MKTFYVIQDVKNKEYYWKHWESEPFTPDITEAFDFESKDQALALLFNTEDRELYIDCFVCRYLEIKEYYTI